MSEAHNTTPHNGSGVKSIAATSIEVARETRALYIPPTVEATKNKLPSRDSIDTLPNELLSHIFGFLDTARPSSDSTGLLDEPRFDFTKSESTPLKAASCVSKLWRRATIPILFKNAQFRSDVPNNLKMPVLATLIKPFLQFVRRNGLKRVIATFTLVVHNRNVLYPTGADFLDDDISSFWYSLFDIIDPIELLIIAHVEALGALTNCHLALEDRMCVDSPCHYLLLQRPPTPSAVIVADKVAHPSQWPTQVLQNDAGQPATEASSTETVPADLSSHEPSDSNQYTIQGHLEMPSQPVLSSRVITSDELERRVQESVLFKIRPWSKLLLNEGSFIRAYATYEFWLRRPPSILLDLVGSEEPPRKPRISPTIRDMSYISIFPMESHFSALASSFPRLDRLYIQLVPRNDILQNKERMAQVESEDLWMERNSCYALLMRELFNAPPIDNFKYLQIFESGDAADADAWHMAVEYVKRAGNGWNVAGDGVFVRDPKDLAPEPEGDDGMEASSLSVY